MYVIQSLKQELYSQDILTLTNSIYSEYKVKKDTKAVTESSVFTLRSIGIILNCFLVHSILVNYCNVLLATGLRFLV